MKKLKFKNLKYPDIFRKWQNKHMTIYQVMKMKKLLMHLINVKNFWKLLLLRVDWRIQV